MFFFFQAEDGIRDRDVTGVQTCALPICWTICVDTGAAPSPSSPHTSVSRSGSTWAKFPTAPESFPDRKSTRLNSSHITISYAVFCLKKKKKRRLSDQRNDTVKLYGLHNP